jgi:hypothetical protein
MLHEMVGIRNGDQCEVAPEKRPGLIEGPCQEVAVLLTMDQEHRTLHLDQR